MTSRATGQDASAKVRFGVFEFDPLARDLHKHGVRLKVQEQPLHILALLIERAGQIVPREDLQRAIWPDGTFVEYEQSLNKAVNKLREALGDSSTQPIYIETLARRGYRFVAPLEYEQAAKPTVQPSGSWQRLRPWLVALAGILVIVLAIGLWPVEVPKVERVARLTNDTSRKIPRLISDGNRVFYSDGRDIWSVPVSGGEPTRLWLPFLPASSETDWLYLEGYAPIRQQILMRSEVSSKTHADELWLSGSDGNAPRKIGELSRPSTVALAPDEERLAIGFPDGLHIQSIATGERHWILSWKALSGLWWHPSGRIIGFLDGLTERSKLRAWQVNDDGTDRRRTVPEMEHPQGAGQWSRDGRRFFYFSLDGEIFVRVQTGILGWLRKPVVTRLTASGLFRSVPALDPVNPKRLYVNGAVLRGETMRYDRRGRKWVPFVAGLSAEDIERSADRQWMIYVKFPEAELHKCNMDGSGDVLLTAGVRAVNPRVSPDGRRIVFAGRPAGDLASSLKVWLVSAEGGDAAPYVPETESGFDAVWSHDARKILLGQVKNNRSSGESRLRILHLETGKLEDFPGGEGLFSPRYSPDERQVVALSGRTAALHVYDSSTGKWRELTKSPVSCPAWSSDGKYIYGWNTRDSIVRVEVATGRLEEIARIDFQPTGGWTPHVSWTEDWEPLMLRNVSSIQVYRIDLDR